MPRKPRPTSVRCIEPPYPRRARPCGRRSRPSSPSGRCRARSGSRGSGTSSGAGRPARSAASEPTIDASAPSARCVWPRITPGCSSNVRFTRSSNSRIRSIWVNIQISRSLSRLRHRGSFRARVSQSTAPSSAPTTGHELCADRQLARSTVRSLRRAERRSAQDRPSGPVRGRMAGRPRTQGRRLNGHEVSRRKPDSCGSAIVARGRRGHARRHGAPRARDAAAQRGPVTNYRVYVGGKPVRRTRSCRRSSSARSTRRAARSSIGPGWTNGIKTAVQYVNRYLGGVQGHPLVVSYCFTTSAEEEGTKCGQKFANDQADQGRRVRRGRRRQPVVLRRARDNKPVVGGVMLLPVDAQRKNNFALFGTNDSVLGPWGTLGKDLPEGEDRRGRLLADPRDRLRRAGREGKPRVGRDQDDAGRLRRRPRPT